MSHWLAEYWFWLIVFTAVALAGWALYKAVAGKNTKGETEDPAVFLFEFGILKDTNPPARMMLTKQNLSSEEWPTLCEKLQSRFVGLPKVLGLESANASEIYPASNQGDPAFVLIDQNNSMARVSIHETVAKDEAIDQQHIRDSHVALELAPNPIWHTSATGEVVWVNAAYRKLVVQVGLENEGGSADLFSGIALPSEGETLRTSITDKEQANQFWFDVSSITYHEGRTHFAIDTSAIVNAEVAQRNFVQTLTKTFAQLSIGLALFDRNRQLALFNPALIDLSSLPASFLSSRPSLLTFFDKLRENRMIPEPKNYSSWREQIAELVVAAADDRYSEIWTLPSGVTYRVVGRPHPDGAIALLFEDISAEVSLTRRFRSELELGQSIMDSIAQPLVVFSPVGTLTFCNRAYQKFWGTKDGEELMDVTIDDAVTHWRARCNETDLWDQLHARIRDLKRQSNQSYRLPLKSGGQMMLGVQTVHDGATLVTFQLPTDETSSTRTREVATV